MMAQQLQTLAVLQDDPSSIPRTHSSSQGSDTLFGSLSTPVSTHCGA